MTNDNADIETELRSLLAGGHKIEAIKLYRQRTGVGLAEAKAAVEALERGEPVPTKRAMDSTLEQEVVSLLEQGKKIRAIKVYRERTGSGLKEAKEAIEVIAAEHRVIVPSGSGCLEVLVLIVTILLAAGVSAEDRIAKVSDAMIDKDGFRVHNIESSFQAGRTQLKVLLPDRLGQGKQFPVVYVLPVEARNENRYGDGLLEVKRRDLQNKYQAIFVAPTFSHLPWYADHPTDLHVRQETYFLKVVLPSIEKQYPVQTNADGRFLLGFSKSGWGAFSLLLRHPDVFGKAAAWDAPLMKDKPDQFGMEGIFGTQENFEKYQIIQLLKRHAAELRDGNRIILSGYDYFRKQHQQTHEVMGALRIPHEYRDGPERKHDWHSGWVEEAVGLLFQTRPELARSR